MSYIGISNRVFVCPCVGACKSWIDSGLIFGGIFGHHAIYHSTNRDYPRGPTTILLILTLSKYRVLSESTEFP